MHALSASSLRRVQREWTANTAMRRSAASALPLVICTIANSHEIIGVGVCPPPGNPRPAPWTRTTKGPAAHSMGYSNVRCRSSLRLHRRSALCPSYSGLLPSQIQCYPGVWPLLTVFATRTAVCSVRLSYSGFAVRLSFSAGLGCLGEHSISLPQLDTSPCLPTHTHYVIVSDLP